MYRVIDSKLWTDGKVKKLRFETKAFFIYLITCPESHSSGIFYLAIPTMTHHTGLSTKEVNKHLRLLQSSGMVVYDYDNDMVWVKNMLRHFQGKSKQYLKSVGKHLNYLHKVWVVGDFIEYYSDLNLQSLYPIDTLSIPPRQGVDRADNGTGTDFDIDIGTNINPPSTDTEETPKENDNPKQVILTDPCELESALECVDLDAFRERFGPKGLDVDACFEDFKDYVLNGSSQKPFPNPSRWVNFKNAFRDSCKRSIRDRRHILIPADNDDYMEDF